LCSTVFRVHPQLSKPSKPEQQLLLLKEVVVNKHAAQTTTSKQQPKAEEGAKRLSPSSSEISLPAAHINTAHSAHRLYDIDPSQTLSSISYAAAQS